jgi:hypothetical protein
MHHFNLSQRTALSFTREFVTLDHMAGIERPWKGGYTPDRVPGESP